MCLKKDKKNASDKKILYVLNIFRNLLKKVLTGKEFSGAQKINFAGGMCALLFIIALTFIGGLEDTVVAIVSAYRGVSSPIPWYTPIIYFALLLIYFLICAANADKSPPEKQK